MECNISLKVHTLHENLGDVSGKHDERFYQDISMMERCCKEKWNSGMLEDYCCGIKREDYTPHKRLRRTTVV